MRKVTILGLVVAMAVAMAFGCSGSEKSTTEQDPQLNIGDVCTNNEECSSGLCQGGVCAEVAKAGGVEDEGCLTDSDCSEGFTCKEGVCSSSLPQPIPPDEELSGIPDAANTAKAEFQALMESSLSACMKEIVEGNAICGCLSITAEQEGKATVNINSCVTSGNLTFTGSVVITEPLSMVGTMTTFGDCTNVQLNITGECQGTIVGTCGAEEFNCVLNGAEGDACDCNL